MSLHFVRGIYTIITLILYICANLALTYIALFDELKRGDRRVRIFSAHNNWWVTPEVSLPLPYQRSANVFLNSLRQGVYDSVLL